MKFKKVEIQAFRAYDNVQDGTFDFLNSQNKSADFISIYAPNGFGKTSFYDAVEWGFTNNIQRFLKRTAENLESAKAERNFISENKDGFKQFILRNKYSDPSTESFVKLYTTSSDNPLVNKLDPPRKGQPDFKFKKEDTFEGKGFFHDVILSQEWIDAFLKEDDASIRYDKFIAFFGDKNLDSQFKIINGLIKTNDSTINKLVQERNRIKSKLDRDIDTEIMTKVNNLILDLNNEGKRLEAIESTYSDNDFFNFSSQIIQTVATIDNQIQQIDNQIDLIDRFFLAQSDDINIEQYYHSKDNLSELELLQTKLNRDKQVLDSFKKLELQRANIAEEFVRLNKEMADFEALYGLHPAYLNIQSELTNENEKLKACNQQIEICQKQINGYLLKDRELGRSIYDNEQKVALLQGNLNRLPSWKEEKRLNELNLKSLQQQVDGINIINGEIEKELNKLNIRRSYLAEIQIFIGRDNYHFHIEDLSELFVTSVNKILKYQISLNDLITRKEEIERKISSQRVFDSDLKQLISLSTRIVSENQLKSCPTCGTEQNTIDDLIHKIIKNSLLSDMEATLLKTKSDIESEYSIINNEIRGLGSELTKLINEEKLQLSNKERLSEISKQDNNGQIRKIESEISECQSRLEQIKAGLLNFDFDDFEKFQKNEIHKIEVQLSTLRDEKAVVLQKLESESSKLATISESGRSIKDKVELLMNDTTYLKVLTFLQSRYVDPIDSGDYLLSEYNRLQGRIDEIIQLENTINLEIESLRLKLLSIEDHEMDEKINSTTELIIELKQKLLSFENSVSSVLNIPSFSIDKDVLVFLINDERGILQTSKQKKTSIKEKYDLLLQQKDLLVRFLNYESLQKQINAIDEKIALKRDRVRLELNEERQRVSTYIHHQVENFFYEDLINSIYRKIDPHPDCKKITFKCDFAGEKPKLNVFVVSDIDEIPHIPNLYFSTAQLNILSLSIFLAKALNTKDDNGQPVDSIFIDDPIQSMDSINILSSIA